MDLKCSAGLIHTYLEDATEVSAQKGCGPSYFELCICDHDILETPETEDESLK